MKAYLEKLIKVLSEEDLEKVKSIPFKISKIKIYLAYLVQTRNGKEMTKQELMSYLKVDDKMMRKMKSVLLRRCYDTLAPESGIALLDILSRYRLVENYKRELLYQEIKIKKWSVEEKRKFYEAALTFMMRLPFSALDVNELNQYAELNLKFAKDSEREVHALIYKGRILVIRMLHEYYHRDKKKPNQNAFIKTIESLEAANKKFKDEVLDAIILFCKAQYAYSIEMNFQEAKILFAKLRNEKKKLMLLPKDFANAVNGFYATSLYQLNEFDNSLAVFQENIDEKNAFFLNQPHLLSRLCELYMIKGKMAAAKEILDNHLKRFLESGEQDAVQITSITYSKYYMLNEQLSEAFESLQVARQNLNKKFYLMHDVEIRTLELIYFILSGDMKFAKAIMMRTLKFLREKVKTKELKQQIVKQELIARMCKAKTKNRSMDRFMNSIPEVFSGFDTVYGIMLQRYCLKNPAIQ